MILLSKRAMLFVLVVGMWPLVAFSQALSLAECLKRAEQASYRLQAAQFRDQVAEKEVSLKKAENLPQLYGSFSYEHHRLAPYRFSQQWSLLQGDWALGSFILKTQNIEQKRALAARQEMKAQRLTVGHRTVTLFIGALKQKESYSFLKQRLRNLQLHRQVAKALWQAGAKTELDVLQTESEMLKLKEEMEQSLSERRMLLDELAILIGKSAKDSLRLRSFNSAQIADTPLPTLRETQLERHPLLRMFQFNLEAARLTKKAVRAAQLPHLQLGYGFVVDHDPTADGNYWLASVGISLPLYQWNRSKIDMEKRQIVFNALKSEQSAALRQLRIEAQKTLAELEKLKRILQIQRQRVKKSEQANQIALTHYKAGLISNLEYLNAQEQFTEAQIALHNTQLDYALQLAQFYILTNQPEKIESW